LNGSSWRISSVCGTRSAGTTSTRLLLLLDTCSAGSFGPIDTAQELEYSLRVLRERNGLVEVFE
jgi:hypothetical protein